MAVVPQASADYPLGTWRMFQANPEHTGETTATLPPVGHIVWSYRANPADKPEGGAAVDGDVVFVGLGSKMVALNASSGARIWTYIASGRIFSTPALYKGLVYFASEASDGVNNTYALNAATGGLVWAKNETIGLGGGIHFIHGSPTVVNDMFYVGSYTYMLYSRHASNGTLAWSADLLSEVIASPAVVGDTVYAVSAGIHDPVLPSWTVPPRLWAFNATTGGEIWNQTITQGHLLASPVVVGGLVYAATAGFSYFSADIDSGYVLAFDAATGAPQWTSPDVGRMIATPAVSGSIMYVAGAGDQSGGLTSTTARLRWLDLTANGTEITAQPVGDNASMESSPAAVGTRVVAASRDGAVALFLASGARVWSYTLPSEVIAPVAVANDMIFVPALDGTLYAFGAQPDFSVAPQDVVLLDPTPHAGEPTTLQVILRNVGDKMGSGVVTAQVNQSGNVWSAATWNVSDLDKGAVSVLRNPLRLNASGDVNITVSISGVVPYDGNNMNDATTVSYTALAALSGWEARYSDGHGTNFLETDTPQNNVLLWRQAAFTVDGGGFVAYGNTLVFVDSSANRLVAAFRDRGNETPAWVWNASAPIVGSPVLANGYLAVATAAASDPAGNISFIDPDTGALHKTVAISAHPTASGVPQGDSIFFAASDRIVEVSVATLALVRELPTVDVPPVARPALRAEPVVLPGWAFVVSSTGELHAFNLTTGTEPAGWPVQLRASTSVPLVAGGGFLFAVNGPAIVSAFSLSPLSPTAAWNATFDEPVTGAMGLGYGRLFVPTATNVTALIAGSGALAWNRTLTPPQPGNAVRAAGNATVYAGSERLFSLSVATGALEWTFEPGADGPITSSAALFGGTLHLQTELGRVLTLGLVKGRPPTAVIASPLGGVNYRALETVLFSSVGTSDPDNETLEYFWDFGDGGTGVNASEEHAYSFPGDFRVRLTVTDGLRLSSTRTVDIHVIDNNAPLLTVPPEDILKPDAFRQNLEDTIWTFKVRYYDPDGDPPFAIALNVSNETDPLKMMLPVSGGPYNFTDGVDYYWTGTLAPGKHTYLFEGSDGLASASTPPQNLSVYRVETRVTDQLTYSVMYVGAGLSELTPVTGIIPPTDFGTIDRFSVTLPANATNILWIQLEFRYGAWVNVSEFLEETISVYARDRASNAWVREESVPLKDNDTVVANISISASPVFTVDAVSHRPTATFGVFGKPTVAPLPPLCEANSGTRILYAPGEVVSFSASDSVERNDGNKSNLTFSWDFGDGTPNATSVAVNHTYASAGSYEVVLSAVNSYGQTCNPVKRLTLTVRSEQSTSTFLWLAALIVGALFAVAVIWPVSRRRTRAEPRTEPEEGRAIPTPHDRPTPQQKRASRANDASPDEDEQAVLDALNEESESPPKGGL